MAKPKLTTKHIQINRAQSRIMLVVGIATIISVFCLVSTKELLSQSSYHRREIAAKKTAAKQLTANLNAANALAAQYQIFDSSNPNVIGGKNSNDPSTRPPDGDNARIVLNALPSKYDFPALISSLSQILSANSISNPGIGGTDQTATIDNAAVNDPQPVPLSVSVSGATSYEGVKGLIKDFERSVRPFDVKVLELRGSAGNMTFNAELETYFQPGKTLSTQTMEVH